MGRSSDARARLIESGMELIFARSYQAVSVEEVCEHADVRRGSFHYFFRTKQALALAVVEEHWRRAQEQVLQGAFAEELPPLERIARYVEAVHAFQRLSKQITGQMPGCQFGNLVCELGTQDETLRLRIEAVFAGAARFIQGAVQDAVAQGQLPQDADPAATAEAILAFVEGMLVLGKASNDPELIRRLGSAATGIVVHRPQ